MLGEAGIDSARRRVHDCERPIRLRGATKLVNPTTGETRTLYASAQELDGTTWIPCGNRRAAACEPCSRQYQGDAWQLVTTGLAGGKGIPADGRGAPVHVRHAHRALVRAGARAAAEGALPGPPRQARLPARPAAVVRPAPP